jgi:hypothetical protein
MKALTRTPVTRQTDRYPAPGATLWAKSRIRDRMQARIAREHHESLGLSHRGSVARSPDTPLAVTKGARRTLRAIGERMQVKEGRTVHILTIGHLDSAARPSSCAR